MRASCTSIGAGRGITPGAGVRPGRAPRRGAGHGALVMAVAGAAAPCPASSAHRPGQRVHRGLLQSRLPAAIHLPVHRQPGSALDNAVIESWHSTLEIELQRVEHYATRATAQAGVAAWIEDYNHQRRHSSLGRVSRWITSGRWRERTPRERGPAAARPRNRRRRLRRAHLHHRAAAFQAGGRAARGYGAAPPASSPSGPQNKRESTLPGTRHAKTALTPETSAAPQAGSTSRPQPAPAQERGASKIPHARHKRTPGNEMNWRSIVRRSGEITRIGYEEDSTV